MGSNRERSGGQIVRYGAADLVADGLRNYS
jgi:hypothetical protein